MTSVLRAEAVRYLPDPRYFVPDLSPRDRSTLAGMRVDLIFVAESPHVSEVEPEETEERRPLCGMAGRQWWGLLSELLEGETNSDVSLKRLINFCLKNHIVIMNAVQYPLDPKIVKSYPNADPVTHLGFSKIGGTSSYRKLKNTPAVIECLYSLRDRLCHSSVAGAPIYCLGNDAEWFVNQALKPEEIQLRVQGKIPHPSAWWRQNGLFGRIAREKLMKILSDRLKVEQ